MRCLQSTVIIILILLCCTAAAEELPPWEGYGISEIDEMPGLDFDLFPSEPGVSFSDLDELGRPGPAYAVLSASIFPDSPRSSLQSFTPAGWRSVKYPFIPSGYLYNRSHLIGNLFTGDDILENLFTGTQYLNQEIMYSIESSLYYFLQSSGRSVYYAVLPVYIGDELLPRGLYLYAESIEDHGAGFYRFCYLHNVQPGIIIDYADGESFLAPVSIE